MADELQGRTVAILCAEGTSEADHAAVRQALRGTGARAVTVGETGDEPADLALDDVREDALDGVVIPGGIAGADALRRDERAVDLVRELFLAGKPVGAIGHGAWVLVEAGIAAGRSVAAAPGLRTDLRNAGGALAAEPVHVDGALVTARGSPELAGFAGRFVEALRHDRERRASAETHGASVDEISEESFPASDPPPPPTYL